MQFNMQLKRLRNSSNFLLLNGALEGN